ncbi:lipase family protein [Paratractidigestivibacter sp.]|uniref:lipase family protein n=1 Tax=Paratractidigestivibacter sp. TaxID=2847316 RepID=UPI002AC8BECC|nr:hypothetical protein [Paratractidigestivibacter sp.]
MEEHEQLEDKQTAVQTNARAADKATAEALAETPVKAPAEAAGATPAKTKPRRRRHRGLKVALIVVACVAAIASLVFTGVVQWRLGLASSSDFMIGEPQPIEAVEGSVDASGNITANVTYSSIVADDGKDATETIEWNDDWFFADSSEYNHQLARTAIVLSTVANSESVHYQAGSDSGDYMENILAQLGFDNMSTASYQYRSEIIDQLSAVFKDKGTDVTAYTIASKEIVNSQTGEKKLLVMAAVRGSYGTEWLSNLAMNFRSSMSDTYGYGENDHQGFSEAAQELESRIFSYIMNLGHDPRDLSDISLFVCGHSRGGAITNLLGSAIDKEYYEAEAATKVGAAEVGKGADGDVGNSAAIDGAIWIKGCIPARSLYAYAFATPELTESSDCRDAMYNNIFNIMNPSDLVPRMPLNVWGYERYGVDLWLPEYGNHGFDQQFIAVCAKFSEHVRCETKSDPTDVEDVDKIVSDIAEVAPTIDDFKTPVGVVKSLYSMINGHDIVRIIHSHAPDLYCAWMETIDASDLRTTR